MISMSHPSPSTIVVRPGTVDDAELMTRWAIALAWESEHKTLDPVTVSAGIRGGLADPERARYFVAERSGITAGMLMLTTEWSDWRNGNWWWIQSVYVASEHRRCGVYAALHRHVANLAKAEGNVCGLRLYVEKENATAQRTYGSLGMADAGYLVFETRNF